MKEFSTKIGMRNKNFSKRIFYGLCIVGMKGDEDDGVVSEVMLGF